MKVWLIQIGEPLPLKGENPRLLRTGLFAEFLAKNGHDVTWWASTFEHQSRSFKFNADTEYDISKNYKLMLLHSCSYKGTSSPKRFFNHYHLAKKFKKFVPKLEKPDVIVASMPSIELCDVATQFGKKNNIPVVLDIRDMWPEIFVHRVPLFLKPLVRLFFNYQYSSLKRAARDARAIFGITGFYRDYGLKYAKREKINLDQVYPMVCKPAQFSVEQKNNAREFWASLGVTADKFIISFVGTFSSVMDFGTVIEVIRKMKCDSALFVLAGSGDHYNFVRKELCDATNVVLPGWVDAPCIDSLLSLSSIGLAPYRNLMDFQASIPNKAIEYLAYGLPIATSLKRGILVDSIDRFKCGFSYASSGNFVTLVLRYIQDARLLKVQIQNALSFHQEDFQFDSVCEQMMSQLESIAKLGG